MAVIRNKSATKVVYKPEEKTYLQQQLEDFFNPTKRRQEPVMDGVSRAQSLQPGGGTNAVDRQLKR